MIAGVDEAGCGALIGPLVASAVCLPDDFDTSGIKDSKKLSEKKREVLSARIRDCAHVGIGIVTLDEINSQPFGDLRRRVFERALLDLFSHAPLPSRIIIDGTGFFDGLADIPFECVAKADTMFACVSAASIVAKTVRDGLIKELCEANESRARMYGWSGNKGYPTREHLRAIREHGITDHHRSSFKPCKCAEPIAGRGGRDAIPDALPS